MRKNIKLIVISIIMLFTLTGCAAVDYEITVNSDGSANINYILGYNKQFFNNMGVNPEDMEEDSFVNFKKEAEESGYHVEEYSDDNILGFKATKQINNVQEEFSLKEAFGEENIKNDNKFVIEKTFLNTKYLLDLDIDLTEISSNSEGMQAQYINSFMNQTKMTMRINLPGKILTSNATTISENGKTVEWNLIPGQVNKISLEATQINIVSILLIVGIVIVLIAIIIFAIVKKKSKNDKNVDKE